MCPEKLTKPFKIGLILYKNIESHQLDHDEYDINCKTYVITDKTKHSMLTVLQTKST